MDSYTTRINQLTRQYNDAIRALENSYNMESTQGLGWNLSSSYLRRQYSKRYEALAREYRGKVGETLSVYKQTHPEWAKWRTRWERIFIVGIIVAVIGCIVALPADDSYSSSPTASGSSAAVTYWNAENIPMPHLKDASQYVSNPDNVLSQQTVDIMNGKLQRLDSELNIESVVIVVNHIEGDDPFRMAQDVGNKYGVGRQDRGLVVVVGYEDHSINISPGRALEGDLTDAECYRLQQRYVIPAMRAEMPDSGMIYLTEAIYSTLQQKGLPDMPGLSSQDDDLDSEVAAVIGLWMLSMLAWGIVFLRLNRKYHWVALLGSVSLLANPFYVAESSGFSGGGFGGFGGGGSFGGGGGSFGGGSFGGGGATSRW